MEKRDTSCIHALSSTVDESAVAEGEGDIRQWEVAEGEDCNVKFSLKSNVEFWEEHLKPSQFVLNVIRHGYLLPLTKIPTPFYAKNNKSALRHPKFVGEAIENLLKGGLVEELSRPAYCSNPLTVAEKGKLRLVLDLRHVNALLHIKKIQV